MLKASLPASLTVTTPSTTTAAPYPLVSARRTLRRTAVRVLLLAGLLLVAAGPANQIAFARLAPSVAAFAPNPLVGEMLAKVEASALYADVGSLSGEWPVNVGGVPNTLTSRHTASGLPVQAATQYVVERLQGLGLTTAYQTWTAGGYTNRNVVGELYGATHPEEVVLMTAHLDDMPGSGPAPGADDNASGAAALLTAARILRDYQFDRTVRLVFFTGEEQGLLGSQQYALALANAQRAGDPRQVARLVAAVYNVDMIGWDSAGGPVAQLHARPTPEDLALADVFTQVVGAYGLAGLLTPSVRVDSMGRSDHASFWAEGFPAVLAIEDYGADFNPYYHSPQDRRSNFNLGYYTNFVKASVGTVAQLAQPLRALTTAHLGGRVTDSASGAPLANVTVQAQALTYTRVYSAVTAASGAYTLTVYPATYTLQAWKVGYTPQTVTGEVLTDTTSAPLDWALLPARLIFCPAIFR